MGLGYRVSRGEGGRVVAENIFCGSEEWNMLETKDLILDKAKFSDWKDMYTNVWQHPETARYMMWRITTSESDAKVRIRKTMEFQKYHDTYLVYEKGGGKAIGFAGVEEVEPFVYQEAGICLGPDYVGRGFGTQILACLMQYCKDVFGAKEFIYSSRDENPASRKLAESFGFTVFSTELETDCKDGHPYHMLRYRREL